MTATVTYIASKGAEPVVARMSDGWKALEQLDVRFKPLPQYQAEIKARNERYEAMQKRKEKTREGPRVVPTGKRGR